VIKMTSKNLIIIALIAVIVVVALAATILFTTSGTAKCNCNRKQSNKVSISKQRYNMAADKCNYRECDP